MAHDDEQLAIAQFLAEKGVTACPPAFVAPTGIPMSSTEEQKRLGELSLKPWLTGKAAYAAGLRAARGRERAVAAVKGPRR